MNKYTQTFSSRIVIIEDNAELRNVYSLVLKSIARYDVIATYETAEEALKELPKLKPDLAIVDLTLPGMPGISAIYKIKKMFPNIKVMVVTVHDDHESVFNSFCAGAIGYLTKDADPHDLIRAVDQVFAGGAPMTPKIATMIISSFHTNPNSPLTERETDVLRQLSQGKSYDYIAAALNVTRDTVKTHIRHIYEKLQVNNKSEAVIKARKDNLV
jgi:DNA-binding NarL/FixJ family response regulator